MYNFSLSTEAIAANRAFYIATLKRLFSERGRSMSRAANLLKREVDGRIDKYSKTVLLLGPKGLEPAYYNFDTKEWVRTPKNKDEPLLSNSYIDPDWNLEEMVNRLVFDYMIGNIKITDVGYKTSHIYKK